MKAPFLRHFDFGRLVVTILATIGLLCVIALLFLLFLRQLLYEVATEDKLASPSGDLIARREVTSGGFGTVWTTRVIVSDKDEARETVVYSNQDSDYVPKWKWLGDETLLLSLPCDRVDHVGSPAGWPDGAEPFERFNVRFSNISGQCEVRPEE